MSAHRTSRFGSAGRLGVVAAGVVCSAAVVAAPAAAVVAPSDANGYQDSTARCSTPAVVFGSTASSRVAICSGGDGSYQYRGVRVSDGAKLILPAKDAGNGSFVAQQNGVTYTVSASDLVVKAGSTVLRDEPMVDFHGAPGSDPAATSPAPGAAPRSVPAPTTTSAPPSKPLPAEVGGSAAAGG